MEQKNELMRRMSLMSRKVDYALLILAYLDQHPEISMSRRKETDFFLLASRR